MSALYLRLKTMLPGALREALSAVNQRFFARRAVLRKYGDWFEADWRKKYRSLSDEEWTRAYDEAWKRHANDCVDETDAETIIGLLRRNSDPLSAAPATVLEVGCGAGSLAIAMAKAGFGVTCLDVSGEALDKARARAEAEGAAIEWRQGFAEAPPFADKTFDHATCCHTLEHVKDLAAAVAGLKRVARKTVIALVPKQPYRLYAGNYHTQFFTRKEQLVSAFALERYECEELRFLGRENEFQGDAFLYVGYLSDDGSV